MLIFTMTELKCHCLNAQSPNPVSTHIHSCITPINAPVSLGFLYPCTHSVASWEQVGGRMRGCERWTSLLRVSREINPSPTLFFPHQSIIFGVWQLPKTILKRRETHTRYVAVAFHKHVQPSWRGDVVAAKHHTLCPRLKGSWYAVVVFDSQSTFNDGSADSL